MAREILRFCTHGYISKVDNYCYRVTVTLNGNGIADQHQFGRNCSTQKINYQANQLGGLAFPSPSNGWEVITQSWQNPTGRSEYVLQDKFYGRQYWKAWNAGTGMGWKASLIGDATALNAYYGNTPTTTPGKLPVAPPPAPPEPPEDTTSFTAKFKDIDPLLIAAVAVVLIAIGWYLWKR